MSMDLFKDKNWNSGKSIKIVHHNSRYTWIFEWFFIVFMWSDKNNFSFDIKLHKNHKYFKANYNWTEEEDQVVGLYVRENLETPLCFV